MNTKRATALLAFLAVAALGTGCDRLSNWQDLIDGCDCPTGGGGGGGGAGGEPPPSPATTPDGRPCSDVPNSPNCPRQA